LLTKNGKIAQNFENQWIFDRSKVGTQICFVSLQIANPQILGLIPQSKIQKFLECQSTNPQKNDYSANHKPAILGVSVRKSQILRFVRKIAGFLDQIRIGVPHGPHNFKDTKP
jgi:hypothetical protein